MGLVQDIINDAKRTVASSRVLRDEKALRHLAPNEAKAHRMPVVYGNNDFLLSKGAAWNGFQVPNKSWGFLGQSERDSYFYNATAVFGSHFPADKENAGHLLVTNRVYTADEWQEGLLARYDDASAVFGKYVQASREEIESKEFFERECYLFTRLGARGAGNGIRGMANRTVEFFASSAGIDDNQPELDEQEKWSSEATTVTDTLSTSWLRAEPIHRRRLEWLIRHLDTPGLPTPEVAPADDLDWAAGQWRTTMAAYTEVVHLGMSGKERYSCVEFTAPTGAGKSYAAYLPINHIPNDMLSEVNWLHHSSSLNFPVDTSLFFEIIDPDRAEALLRKPMTDAEAQEEEDAEAGVRPDDVTMLQQQGLRDVKRQVQMARNKISIWQAVLCVYDTDKTELLSKVIKLIKHYKDIHFELVCPPTDQRELFYQSLPGSEILVDDWIHRTDPGYLGAAQPWLTTSVGDRNDSHGLYQGHTVIRDSNGNPQKGLPFFYDLQNVVDEEGKAPTEVVFGNPGSGKTVSRGLKVAFEDALRRITQFVWDPKGDFLPLKAYAKRLKLDNAKVKLVDIFDTSNSVSLDSFGIAEVDTKKDIDERASSALEVLENLCHRQLNAHGAQSALLRRLLDEVVKEVMNREATRGETPKMKTVLSLLEQMKMGNFDGMPTVREEKRSEWQDAAWTLHSRLESVAADTLGRLLFRDPEEAGSIKVEKGDLIIFVALGMTPTEPGSEPTQKSIIADVVSGLMTDFIRSLLHVLEDKVPKSIILDEWHVIKRTKRAEALMDWLRRMGRSKRCMVRQLSQSATDFDNKSVSTIWAGYCQNDEEAMASCQMLGIEKSQANIKLLQALKAGQFLFKDVYGRVAHVQVEVWDDFLLEIFDTQAVSKKEMLNMAAA